jgi:hypothetical protein
MDMIDKPRSNGDFETRLRRVEVWVAAHDSESRERQKRIEQSLSRHDVSSDDINRHLDRIDKNVGDLKDVTASTRTRITMFIAGIPVAVAILFAVLTWLKGG